MPVRKTDGERDCQPTGLMGGFGVGCIKIPNHIKIPKQEIKIPDSVQTEESIDFLEELVKSFNSLINGYAYDGKLQYQPSAPVNETPSSGRAE